jgi:hypothetical protein
MVDRNTVDKQRNQSKEERRRRNVMYVQGMLKRLTGGKKGKARTVQSVTSLHKYSAVPIPECSSHNTIVSRSWSLSTDHTPGQKWHQKQNKNEM